MAQRVGNGMEWEGSGKVMASQLKFFTAHSCFGRSGRSCAIFELTNGPLVFFGGEDLEHTGANIAIQHLQELADV